MPDFERIIDQKQPLGILTTLLNSEKIPHALLFTGIEGVGKHNTAVTFAMACNCTELNPGKTPENEKASFGDTSNQKESPAPLIPCGKCRSCKKINHGNHPDIFSIKPAGAFIKIDQVRSLYQALLMKPYGATYRVVIIPTAHRMNLASSNALLKILEEPPDRTIFVLITEKKSDLLPTVVSRCHHIQFRPIPRSILAATLAENEKSAPDDVFALASMSKGSLTKAVSMKRTHWIERRNWLIKTIGLDQPGPVKRKPAGLLFSISAQLSENADTLEEYLEMIQSWFRDLVICKYQPEKIIHQDCIKTIKQVSNQFTIASLLSKIETIQSVQRAIQRPGVNLRLTLDILLARLAETAG